MIELYINTYNQYLCTDSNQTDLDTQTGIEFVIKEELDDDADALLTLQNTAAGGGDSEIEEVDYTIGSLRLKIDANDFSLLDIGLYWGEATVIISSKTYVLFQTRVEIKPTAV